MSDKRDVHPPEHSASSGTPSRLLDELIEETRDKVLAVLRIEFRDVISHIDIEDLFQDAVVRLIDPDIPFEFRSVPELERWLIKVAMNKGWSDLKRTVNELSADVPAGGKTPSGEARQAERSPNRCNRLNTVIAGLSTKLQDAIVRDRAGLTHREIAEELGISEVTVRKRLSEARKKITEALLRLGISRSDVLST